MTFLPLLAIFLVLSSVRSDLYDAGGSTNINTPSNGDPQSCILTLSASVHTDQIAFFVFADDQHQDCTHQDIKYSSMFNGDINSGSVILTDTIYPHTQNGSLTFGDVVAYNETACAMLGSLGNGEYLYTCRFMFSSISFHVIFGVFPGNSTFDNNWYNVLFPSYGLTTTAYNTNSGEAVTLPSNQSLSMVVGMLYNQCGSWSNSITDLNSALVVTGKVQQSNAVNLQDLLKDFTLKALIVRQKYNQTSSYLTYSPGTKPFAGSPVNNCSDTGMKYSDFIKDINYCGGDGCVLSFVLQNSINQIYVLETNGIITKAPSRNLRN